MLSEYIITVHIDKEQLYVTHDIQNEDYVIDETNYNLTPHLMRLLVKNTIYGPKQAENDYKEIVKKFLSRALRFHKIPESHAQPRVHGIYNRYIKMPNSHLALDRKSNSSSKGARLCIMNS